MAAPPITEADILADINSDIVANGQNEITADVLRPILALLLGFTAQQVGELPDLETTTQVNLVAAINEVLEIAQNPQSQSQQPRQIIPVATNYIINGVNYKAIHEVETPGTGALNIVIPFFDANNPVISLSTPAVGTFYDFYQKGSANTPTYSAEAGVTLLFKGNTAPAFTGLNSALRFIKVAGNIWRVVEITQKDSAGVTVPVTDIGTVAAPVAGQLILDSTDLNSLKYWNGTDWVGIESAFKLATSGSGTVDETKKVVRSGLTSFGGDDPTRQVEVIGDFWNKQIIAGVGSTIVSTGNNVAVDAGIPAGALTGIETTFTDETSGDRAGAFVGKSNVPGVSDLTAILGINRGANPLAPDEYGRVSVFRAAGGIEHIVLDLEVKNGPTFAHKFRIRDARWETDRIGQMFIYGNGNIVEGYNIPGSNTSTLIGAPTYGIAVDAGGRLMEVPLTFTKKVSFTAAQLRTLDGAGASLPLLPAPGAGKILIVKSISTYLQVGAVGFSEFGGFWLFSGASNIMELTEIGFNGAADKFTKHNNLGFNTSEYKVNAATTIQSEEDTTATGDASLDVFVSYEIITL